MAATTHIIDVTIANFEAAVLQASADQPVLVSLGSPRSEVCVGLTSLLEKAATEMAGSFLLAEVDVDRDPEIAQAFRVQSVPTVILIVKGQPVDAFAGAKSEKELREFLGAHIPLGPATSPLARARELAEEDRVEEAKELLETWLEAHGEDGEARAVLAGWLLDQGDGEGARAHWERILPEGRDSQAARSLEARLDLLQGAGDVQALRARLEVDPGDIAARIELGKTLVGGGMTEEGLEELLEAAMRDMRFEQGAPRKALLEVFAALGPEDPLTLEFQQRLSVLLCS